MPTEEGPEEATLNDRNMVTIPVEVSHHLDLEAGDTLRWSVDDEGDRRSTDDGVPA